MRKTNLFIINQIKDSKFYIIDIYVYIYNYNFKLVIRNSFVSFFYFAFKI